MDLVVSPSIVGFNTQSGGHAPVLTPGQLIDALVLQLIDETTVRLSVAGSIIDVKTQVPLQPGSAVRLAVRGHGNETRLVIVGQGNELAPAGENSAPRASTIQGGNAQPAAVPAQDEVTLSSPLPQTEAPPTAPAAPVRDATPTVALANATRIAAARQTGLAPLFAEAAVAVQSEAVPTPVREAAAKLLLLQSSFEEGVTPQAVAKALSGSGLFLEARLATVARDHLPPSAQEPATPPSSQTRPQVPVTAADIQGDIKAVLFALREALKNWLDVPDGPTALRNAALPDALLRNNDPQTAGQGQTQIQTQAEEHAAIARALNADAKSAPPPLPYRNAPTTGQQPVAPAVAGDAPAKLIGIALLDDTEGALARTTLMQAASLPSAPSLAADPTDVANTHWNLEVPFMTPQGTAIAHFEITRDGHNKGTAAEQRVQGWRVNFSLDVEPMGPVHAQVSLTGHRAAVRLWAERKAAASVLRDSVGELTDALRQASLEPSEVLVRDGAPPRPLKPGAGRFVDRAS